MDPLIFSSLGLLFIGLTTTALIYLFGAHKIVGTRDYPAAMGWTIAFALFICTFLGSAPYLVEHAVWLLVLPFAGLGISLLSIQSAVLAAINADENHRTG